jgi:hypothetical protein
VIRDAERPREHFGHAEAHPTHDDDVGDQAEVGGAEAAEKRGGFAGVAQLGQLDVGHNLGAAPETSEEKDGEHARPNIDHQSQFPATPFLTTISVTASGVLAEKVVATMAVPASHHGIDRFERK